jgi:hypothetical protein
LGLYGKIPAFGTEVDAMKVSQITLVLSHGDDHTADTFEWETAPSCCDRFDAAIAEKAVYVSNTAQGGYNLCYLMLVTADGDWLRSDGIPIDFCPFCGKQILVRKMYRP